MIFRKPPVISVQDVPKPEPKPVKKEAGAPAALEKLLDAQPTDADRAKLHEAGEKFGIRKNDALWSVLEMLQYYERMYGKVPAAVKAAAREATEGVKEAADAAAKAAVYETQAQTARAIVAVAERELATRSTTDRTAYMLIGALFVATLMGVMYIALERNVRAAAFQQGYSEAQSKYKDMAAAATWANTPQGRAAYLLAQAGDIEMLQNCNGPGWIRDENGVCFPLARRDTNRVQGWRTR